MPMPSNSSGLPSATADLGLGGQLGEQVAGETEEARKKRMQQMQMDRALGPAGSLAVTSLGLGGGSAGY